MTNLTMFARVVSIQSALGSKHVELTSLDKDSSERHVRLIITDRFFSRTVHHLQLGHWIFVQGLQAVRVGDGSLLLEPSTKPGAWFIANGK